MEQSLTEKPVDYMSMTVEYYIQEMIEAHNNWRKIRDSVRFQGTTKYFSIMRRFCETQYDQELFEDMKLMQLFHCNLSHECKYYLDIFPYFINQFSDNYKRVSSFLLRAGLKNERNESPDLDQTVVGRIFQSCHLIKIESQKKKFLGCRERLFFIDKIGEAFFTTDLEKFPQEFDFAVQWTGMKDVSLFAQEVFGFTKQLLFDQQEYSEHVSLKSEGRSGLSKSLMAFDSKAYSYDDYMDRQVESFRVQLRRTLNQCVLYGQVSSIKLWRFMKAIESIELNSNSKNLSCNLAIASHSWLPTMILEHRHQILDVSQYMHVELPIRILCGSVEVNHDNKVNIEKELCMRIGLKLLNTTRVSILDFKGDLTQMDRLDFRELLFKNKCPSDDSESPQDTPESKPPNFSSQELIYSSSPIAEERKRDSDDLSEISDSALEQTSVVHRIESPIEHDKVESKEASQQILSQAVGSTQIEGDKSQSQRENDEEADVVKDYVDTSVGAKRLRSDLNEHGISYSEDDPEINACLKRSKMF